MGAGLLDVAAAVNAQAALDPVSKSFGAVPSGSGQDRTATFVITNISDSARTFNVSVADTASDGATFSQVGSGSLSLAPGASATVTVAVDTARGAADGFKQAQLNVSSGGSQVAHAMLFIIVGEAQAAPGKHMVPPPFLQ